MERTGGFRSSDLDTWEQTGLILDKPGEREDDGGIVLYADVVVQGEATYIFYFTHLGRDETGNEVGLEGSCESRCSSIQAAGLTRLMVF
ncbi:hypothetical protein [Paenibacillus monticola]|uniref:Glycosyl hydrolase family 32 N-terminal domain-containing protein n=1 Tax=Paenibacillus monticola TaxID=2666075 RepID=A0A7X2L249_9BACL|nr:hypothetical protein [Paenibacillus monticola]MRN53828.1 hypothetical protein [Paenibacillus monticola]